MKMLSTISALCLLLPLSVVADDTNRANKVLVETVKVMQSVERTMTTRNKLSLLETVQHNLRTIIDHYPSTDLAVKLITGQAIGNISLEGVDRVIEVAKEACLLSPNSACLFSLSVIAAGKIEDANSRDWALNEVASGKARDGNFGGAFDTAKKIEDINIRASALFQIALAGAQAGNFRVAEVYLERGLASEDIEAYVITDRRARVLADIVSAQARAGDLWGALANAQKMDAKSHDRALEGIALGQVQAGEFWGAFHAAEKIEYAGFRDKVLADVVSAQAQAGDVKGALTNARQIGQYYYPFALADIAVAQAKAGDKKRAKEIVDQALAATEKIREKSRVLMKIASAQARAGDVEGARNTAEKLGFAVYRARALMKIAVAQAQAGDVEGAKENFAGALAAAAEKEEMAGGTLRDIVIAQAQAGDVEGALNAERKIGPASAPRVLSKIAVAQVQTGDVEGALTTTGKIESASSRVSALVKVAVAQVQTGDAEGAKESLVRALAIADLIKEGPSIPAGDIEQALITGTLNTADLIDQGPIRVSALVKIAVAQVQAGDAEGAKGSLAQALTTARKIGRASSRAESFTKIASAFAKLE